MLYLPRMTNVRSIKWAAAMAKLNKIKPDTILKNFWKNNDRFADLFNAFYIWLVSRPSRF